MKSKLENFINKYSKNLPTEALDELNLIRKECDYHTNIFNNTPCSISLLDNDGVYLKANPKLMEIVGQRSVIGTVVGSISNNYTILNIINEMKRKGENSRSLYFESSIDSSNKTFWVTINKIDNNFLVMGSDVSEVKNLEQEKELSDKMAFLGEMTAGIVHEINNPLMAISLANDCIQLKATDNKEMIAKTQNIFQLLHECSVPGLTVDEIIKKTTQVSELLNQCFSSKMKDIEEINTHTEKVFEMLDMISKIIQSLKTFARQNPEKEDLSVIGLVEKSKTILSGKISDFEIDIIHENLDELTFEGVEVDFLQVMVNLMSNSIDAIKGLEKKWIKIEWTGTELRFIDSGSGVPEKFQDKLFKKFFSSKGAKGNGIGLYLSRQMLNRCGLDLQYKTEDGHTCFKWVVKDPAVVKTA